MQSLYHDPYQPPARGEVQNTNGVEEVDDEEHSQTQRIKKRWNVYEVA